MIGKLTGIIDSIDDTTAILDVGGVGYQVFCPASTLQNLHGSAERVSLFIETHVREDHIHLYGFLSIEEKKTFILLMGVSGVGAKMALAILSAFTPDRLQSAIAAADVAAFKPVSGVGPKLANRLVTELKDKMGTIAIFPTANTGTTAHANDAAPSHATGDNIGDAIAALASLGYSRSDAYQVVHRVAAEKGNMELDFLIRESLKTLSTV